MARYSSFDIQTLLRIPAERVMRHFGKDSTKIHGMYFSPLRNENTPSFRIDPKNNIWYDFGLGEGGGILDLVQRLASCSRHEALDILAEMEGTIEPEEERKEFPHCTSAPKEHPITVEKDYGKVIHDSLHDYVSQRGISEKVIERWVHEVRYTVKGRPGSLFHAIGFMNNKGGYVLRSERTKKSTSCWFTSISASEDGESGIVAVFEGFMDFLSWCTFLDIDDLPCDVCVLNSTVNAPKASPWIAEHGEVELYLDNDDAGRTASGKITDYCKGHGVAEVRDLSPTYADFKDYNDMILGRRKDNL